MSSPKMVISLALTTVDIGGNYTQYLGQIRVWTGTTVPTAGPETYLQVLEGLLFETEIVCSSLSEQQCWQRRPQGNILLIIILSLFILFCSVDGVVVYIIYFFSVHFYFALFTFSGFLGFYLVFMLCFLFFSFCIISMYLFFFVFSCTWAFCFCFSFNFFVLLF